MWLASALAFLALVQARRLHRIDPARPRSSTRPMAACSATRKGLRVPTYQNELEKEICKRKSVRNDPAAWGKGAADGNAP